MEQFRGAGTQVIGIKRKNGFQPPLTRDQMIVWILYMITVIIHFVEVTWVCSGRPANVLCIIAAVMFVVISTCWYTTTWIDPEFVPGDKPAPTRYNCVGQEIIRSNAFCNQCRKSIYGLDHHCALLNTCIGSKNYIPFIILIIIATLQMLFHIIFSVVLLTNTTLLLQRRSRFNGDNSYSSGFYFLIAIQLLISFIGFIGVTVLLAFHIYLNFIARKGTYDWILWRRSSRLDFSPPSPNLRSREASVNIMEEISNSFSSNFTRNKVRRSLRQQQPPPQYQPRTALVRIDSAADRYKESMDIVLDNKNDDVCGIYVDSQIAASMDFDIESPKPKARLTKSDLMRQKSNRLSAVVPEVRETVVIQGSRSNDLIEPASFGDHASFSASALVRVVESGKSEVSMEVDEQNGSSASANSLTQTKDSLNTLVLSG